MDRADAYYEIRRSFDWPNDDDCDYAESILTARYHRDAASLADCVANELVSGEIENYSRASDVSEAVDERLRYICDGNRRVIYTWLAHETVFSSSHRAEAKDKLNDLGIYNPTIERWAFECMLLDTREALPRAIGRALGLDGEAVEVEEFETHPARFIVKIERTKPDEAGELVANVRGKGATEWAKHFGEIMGVDWEWLGDDHAFAHLSAPSESTSEAKREWLDKILRDYPRVDASGAL